MGVVDGEFDGWVGWVKGVFWSGFVEKFCVEMEDVVVVEGGCNEGDVLW